MEPLRQLQMVASPSLWGPHWPAEADLLVGAGLVWPQHRQQLLFQMLVQHWQKKFGLNCIPL